MRISNEKSACGKFFLWLGNARGDRRFLLSFSRNYYILTVFDNPPGTRKQQTIDYLPIEYLCY